jgi:hypothetical protein
MNEPIQPIQLERKHLPNCPELRARTCTAPIECEHGFDACPECDACSCAEAASAAHELSMAMAQMASNANDGADHLERARHIQAALAEYIRGLEGLPRAPKTSG